MAASACAVAIALKGGAWRKASMALMNVALAGKEVTEVAEADHATYSMFMWFLNLFARGRNRVISLTNVRSQTSVEIAPQESANDVPEEPPAPPQIELIDSHEEPQHQPTTASCSGALVQ